MGRDVLALIDALDEESAIVVGHDWGAEHAYAAVYLEPDRVDKLVTVAIPPRRTLALTPGTLWAGRHFTCLNRPNAVRRMQRNDFQHVDELVNRWAPAWDVPPDETDPVKNVFAVEESLHAALGYYRANQLGTPSFMSGTLQVPSLLVGGDSDVLPEEAFTERAASAYSGPFRAEILSGGHFVHREDPHAFVDRLLAFLQD
jgi:pimeloyl-ACP methyl ester carboxylesterase